MSEKFGAGFGCGRAAGAGGAWRCGAGRLGAGSNSVVAFYAHLAALASLAGSLQPPEHVHLLAGVPLAEQLVQRLHRSRVQGRVAVQLEDRAEHVESAFTRTSLLCCVVGWFGCSPRRR